MSASDRRLDRLSRFLDSSIRLPGGFRVGWDGVIGLIPGIGDLAGAAMSTYLIAEAGRAGATPIVLARMTLNVVLDMLVGAVPVAGDLFDFVFKANRANYRLFQAHRAQPERTRRSSALGLGGLIVCIVLVILMAVYGVFSLVGALWQAWIA